MVPPRNGLTHRELAPRRADALFAVDWECSDAGAWQYPLHEE
ncbi:hypothetical protein [Streptomyces noursei]|nr:hypothetical protein [Streptomyces noursei]